MQVVLRRELDAEAVATARHSATLYLEQPDVDERAWAHGSLAELALLRLRVSKERRVSSGRRPGGALGTRADNGAGPRREPFPAARRRAASSSATRWWGERRLRLVRPVARAAAAVACGPGRPTAAWFGIAQGAPWSSRPPWSAASPPPPTAVPAARVDRRRLRRRRPGRSRWGQRPVGAAAGLPTNGVPRTADAAGPVR